MPDLNITITLHVPDVETLTDRVPHEGSIHVCPPGCGCWDAADRAQRALESDSDEVATDVDPVDGLRDTIVDTLRLLERAGLIPRDREYTGHTVDQFVVQVGSWTFEAKVVPTAGGPRFPEYIVTLSHAQPGIEPSKRSTAELEDVRAWMIAWAAEVAWR